jgi:hypothetical protein
LLQLGKGCPDSVAFRDPFIYQALMFDNSHHQSYLCSDGFILDQDSSLLEFAWEELVEGKKDVNAMELAKVNYCLIIY